MCNNIIIVGQMSPWSDPKETTQAQRLGYVFRHNYNPLAAMDTPQHRGKISQECVDRMRTWAEQDPVTANELLAAINWGSEIWRDLDEFRYGEYVFFSKRFIRGPKPVEIQY